MEIITCAVLLLTLKFSRSKTTLSPYPRNTRHHFFFQREPAIKACSHVIIGYREIARQLLTPPDDARIAAVQELHPEHSIVHPSVALGVLRDEIIGPAGEEFLVVVKTVPGFEHRVEACEAETRHRAQAVLIEGSRSHVRELRVLGDVGVRRRMDVTRHVVKTLQGTPLVTALLLCQLKAPVLLQNFGLLVLREGSCEGCKKIESNMTVTHGRARAFACCYPISTIVVRVPANERRWTNRLSSHHRQKFSFTTGEELLAPWWPSMNERKIWWKAQGTAFCLPELLNVYHKPRLWFVLQLVHQSRTRT